MPPVLLFDGVCNFCNDSVNFTIKRDTKGIFKFAALQSEKGQELLINAGLKTEGWDSVVLIENGVAYQRSSAVLHVLRRLPGAWSWLYIFIIIPAPIRDFFYNLIAKNRYRLFGQKDSCMVPTPEVRSRFL